MSIKAFLELRAGTESRNRTDTPSQATDFESAASTVPHPGTGVEGSNPSVPTNIQRVRLYRLALFYLLKTTIRYLSLQSN